MTLKNNFIKATDNYNTFESPIPAYYFRRAFDLAGNERVKITVAVCGFYKLYCNGKDITRGFLSPYISNPDHRVYYDEYDVMLDGGENVIGVILGNGYQNNPGGYIWGFDKASFRSAPMFAISVTRNNGEEILVSDENFKISPSPIRSDDYRFGENYDANYEIGGWSEKGFDDSKWSNAMRTIAPNGELCLADVAPVVKECELTPVSIFKSGDGYIYDFGQSNAGICRLRIKGEKGQKIELRHADGLVDGDLNLKRVWFSNNWARDRHIVHLDTYVCKGNGVENYEPSFTYHGFRYVRVDGITEAQATEELLTYLVYHTELHTMGDFNCSDPVTNKLQEITRRSVLSNFHHFPTDCPQREKNGWTADAALTSEVAMLNFDPELNYREWMRNICKAQREDGALPGIIPTGGWGFHWGNGPAWDCVLAYLPYYVYLYRGNTDMIVESAPTFMSYLRYLRTRVDEKGLLCIGLGDWCHVGGIEPKAPLVLTDSVMAFDISTKMAEMFEAVGMKGEAEFARAEAANYRSVIRENLINKNTLVAVGECQTSQAMCLYYGIFEAEERKVAFEQLLHMVHDFDDHIDVGVLGGRVLFHVLAEYGYGDLAFKMITRDDYPSYGNWLKRGATTLWESFFPEKTESMNHHFWGDISAWFIKRVAGIRLNPRIHNVNEVEIHPTFISQLDSVSAYHIAPLGKICVSWERKEGEIILNVELPKGMNAQIVLDDGYCISEENACEGRYRIKQAI